MSLGQWLCIIPIRLRSIFHRQQVESELDEELRFHLDMKIEENIVKGMPPEEARRSALLAIGGLDQRKEECRDARGIRWAFEFIQDIRYGWRILRKSPGLSAIAVLTLTLGIGANAAIFSAVNGILMRPLPYVEPSRLITIQRERIAPYIYITSAQLLDIQRHCTALERIAAYDSRGFLLLTGGVVPKQISTALVSGDFFSLLGTQPLLGRTILPGDEQPGNEPVAVLSYSLWIEAFGGDPGIIGRNVLLDRKPYIVVGVMPREFGLGIHKHYSIESSDGSSEAMWLAQGPPPSGSLNRDGTPLIVARLKMDATLELLNAQLKPLSARFEEAYRTGTYGLQIQARSLDPGINPQVQTSLLILLGAVGFVLLMACVNVASLLVARSWTRQRELAIRKSLGATRMRILRQLLAESQLLASAGGALGLLLSIGGIRFLRLLAPPNTPRVESIALDGRVLLFTMGVSLLVAVLVGLVPALQASSQRPANTLKQSSGGWFAEGMRRPHYLRSGLVVIEVLLAVIVVVGGALMARSFYRLMSVKTGVSAGHTLSLNIRFSDLVCTFKNADWDAQEKKCWMGAQEVLNGILRIPGVRRAALSSGGPFGAGLMIRHYPGSEGFGIFVEGLEDDQLRSGEWVYGRFVTPEYFASLGIPILKGRVFEPADMSSGVAIVSEKFARRYIAGNPLGRRFSTSDSKGRPSWMEIIGVVNDTRDYSMEKMSTQDSAFYSPLSGIGTIGIGVVVQTSADPIPLIPAITRMIQAVDKDALITNIKTVDQILADSAAEPRFQTALMGSFGALGLILAIIGIYGVISYSVVQQTHEIGIHMALGAQRRKVLSMILRKGMLLAAIGIAFGIGGASALTRVLRSLLFEIEPTDTATFIGVVILLMIAAFAACWFPALRAARVDPVVALRHE
jgi:putative ABC transport system permease protein